MNESDKQQAITSDLWKLVLIVALVATVCAVLLPVGGGATAARKVVTRVEAQAIAAALRQYQATYKEFPRGENSDIARKLFGSNSRRLVFLEFRRTNHIGELLDPWRTPYRIEVVDHAQFVIQSAGKDQKFGTKDDYIFDSVKGDFIQEPKR